MNQLLPLIRASIPPVRSRTGRAARGREQTSSILNRQRCAWLALAASCAAYLLLSLPRSQAFHPWGRLTFFDLHVYRGAARLVLDGRSLYAGPIWQWAPFTYPPFAAVVLAPLALLPFTVDAVLVTVLGIVALFTILLLALRLPVEHRSGKHRARLVRGGQL